MWFVISAHFTQQNKWLLIRPIVSAKHKTEAKTTEWHYKQYNNGGWVQVAGSGTF